MKSSSRRRPHLSFTGVQALFRRGLPREHIQYEFEGGIYPLGKRAYIKLASGNAQCICYGDYRSEKVLKIPFWI
jgi:hypothetical protein